MSSKRVSPAQKPEMEEGPELHKIHPNSRKAKQIHQKKVLNNRKKLQRHGKRGVTLQKEPLISIAQWMQEKVLADPEKPAYTNSEVVKMVDSYLEERCQIVHGNAEITSGKSLFPSTYGALTSQQVDQDYTQFKTQGYKAPDLTKKRNVDNLRLWDGDPMHLDVLYMNDRSAVEFRFFKADSI